MTTTTSASSKHYAQQTIVLNPIDDQSDFKSIPIAMILAIFSYLTPKELCSTALINRNWNLLSKVVLNSFFIGRDFSSYLTEQGQSKSGEMQLRLNRFRAALRIQSLEIPKLRELEELGYAKLTNISLENDMIVMERHLGSEEGSEWEGFKYYILTFDGRQQHGVQTPDPSVVKKINPGFILTQQIQAPYTVELWNRLKDDLFYHFPQNAAFLFHPKGTVFALFVHTYELILNFCSPFGNIHRAIIEKVKIDEKIKFEAFDEGFLIYKENLILWLDPLNKQIRKNFDSNIDFSTGRMQCLGEWSSIHTPTDYLIWNRGSNQLVTGSFKGILDLCKDKLGLSSTTSFKEMYLTEQGFILDFTSTIVRFNHPETLDIERIDASLANADTWGKYLFVHKLDDLQAYDLETKTFVTFEWIPREEQISAWTSYVEWIFLGTSQGNVYILNNQGECIHTFQAHTQAIKKIKARHLKNSEDLMSMRLATISEKNELKIWRPY